jgi:hypothetical protein
MMAHTVAPGCSEIAAGLAIIDLTAPPGIAKKCAREGSPTTRR